MVLFAISAFFVLLLLLFVAINCPWGIGCAIVLCLVMTILLYLLSVLFAVGLVGAQVRAGNSGMLGPLSRCFSPQRKASSLDESGIPCLAPVY